MKFVLAALAAFALAQMSFAEWAYDSSAKTLTQGTVVLQNVTASGTNLTIGDNKTNATAVDLDFSTGVADGCKLTQIGQSAFENSTYVTTLVLPDTLTWIGQSAFNGCSNLGGEIVLPDSLTSTGYHAFMGTAVTRAVFGSGMKTANNWLFRNCLSLRSVKWNQCITAIGDQLFYGCTALTTFENAFPADVTTIGASAFYNCSALEGDNLDLVLMKLKSIGGTAFQNSGIKSIEIGGGLASTGNAFFLCSKLESVILHEGTTTIGGDSFPYCTSLTNLVVPSTITTVGACMRNMGSARMHVWWGGVPDVAKFNFDSGGMIAGKSPITHHFQYDDKEAWETFEAGIGNKTNMDIVFPATMFEAGTWGWNRNHVVMWWRTPVAQVGETTYKLLADAITAADGEAIRLLPSNVAEATDERVELGVGQSFAVIDDGHALGYEPAVPARCKLSVARQTRAGVAVLVYAALPPGLVIIVQ
ncbi:MAG: leucine-rich repeat domain-containing protein [Kiritimatiellae bacterium]|nr:leucine-rich repeat domain-containing protein [Kiritimatiellia bacterium]